MKDTLQKLKELKPAQLIIPVIILVLFLGTVVGIVKYQEKAKLNRVPVLEITGPADGAIVTDAQIVVQGKTNKNNTISINGKEAKVEKNGAFYVETPLGYGANMLLIVAKNKSGNKKEIKRIVNRKDTSSVSQAQPDVVATAPKASTQVANGQYSGDGKGNLSSSGPESFWIPEALSLSGAMTAWAMSRKRFKKSTRS